MATEQSRVGCGMVRGTEKCRRRASSLLCRGRGSGNGRKVCAVSRELMMAAPARCFVWLGRQGNQQAVPAVL
jgi:hypothetical protein